MKKTPTKKISKKPVINRMFHQIDANGQVLGRLATQVAILLRGKHKPQFLPHVDLGDFVIVKNIEKIKLTGKKLSQKKYYRFSGYPGGLKIKKMSEVFRDNPAQVLREAVWKMLPKNKQRTNIFKRLKVI